MIEKKRLGPHYVYIDARHEGQRIDNFLLGFLKDVPKSHIYRLLRQGQVRANRGRIKPSYRLKPGDSIRIPPLSRTENRPTARPDHALCEKINQGILYEDGDILVLDKPSGIAVHGGSGIRYGMIDVIRIIRPEFPDMALVHRLDRETSGCLLVAKHRGILLHLHALLRDRRIDKRYLALLKGSWHGGQWMTDVPVRKNRIQSGERMVQVAEDGNSALSVFRLRTVLTGASLVEVMPVTGRTHQIRVHAAHHGYPVAGDKKYGDRQFNRRMSALGLKRLFLHASSLEFELPTSKGKIAVRAPLEHDLRKLINALKHDNP